MEQVGKKDRLSKNEIASAVDYFQLGKVVSYSLISRGVINSNYIIETRSGKYILRAYRFKTEKEIKSEMELLNYLSSKGFPCPIPMGDVFSASNRKIGCFKFIDGKDLKAVNDRMLGEIAKLMGKLHILTKDHRLKYKREGEGISVIKRYLKNKKNIILKSSFKNKEEFISYLESELGHLHLNNDLPKGAIHVDIKAENVILGKNGRLSFIDFDNFYSDLFITDIANAIVWLCVNSKKEVLSMRRANIFLKEYAAIRKMSKAETEGLYEEIKFCCLKGAFKYAYICLPRLKFAESWAYYHIRLYKNILKQDIKFI